MLREGGGGGPTRPVMRYHGGKWRLAPWLLSLFPPHAVYVEPYGGAGSVLMRKPRARGEIYNDLDGETVNVFRVLRDPEQAARLAELARLTPYARDEFLAAYEATDDPVERARRTLTRAAMGISTGSGTRRTKNGFRSKRAGAILPASEWASWPIQVAAFVERLRGVVIENRPAVDVIARYDAPDVLHYVDPPYPAAVRVNGLRSYAHEMDDAAHEDLAAVLCGVQGMALVSGYACPLYARLYEARGWRRVDRAVTADRGAARVESAWLSPRAMAAGRGVLVSMAAG